MALQLGGWALRYSLVPAHTHPCAGHISTAGLGLSAQRVLIITAAARHADRLCSQLPRAEAERRQAGRVAPGTLPPGMCVLVLCRQRVPCVFCVQPPFQPTWRCLQPAGGGLVSGRFVTLDTAGRGRRRKHAHAYTRWTRPRPTFFKPTQLLIILSSLSCLPPSSDSGQPLCLQQPSPPPCVGQWPCRATLLSYVSTSFWAIPPTLPRNAHL